METNQIECYLFMYLGSRVKSLSVMASVGLGFTSVLISGLSSVLVVLVMMSVIKFLMP